MDLRSRIQTAVDDFHIGIHHRPRMYGSPSDIEMAHWIMLELEALLMEPAPDDKTIRDARLAAHCAVVEKRDWPGPLPMYTHVGDNDSEAIVPLLEEKREEFLRFIREAQSKV